MQITGDLNDEYLIMSMISRHVVFATLRLLENSSRCASTNSISYSFLSFFTFVASLILDTVEK